MTKKLSRNRTKILEFLRSVKNPINAGKIVKYFREEMDQATVYRNLSFLEINNLIESFVYDCTKMGTQKYYYSTDNNNFHFLHCKKCHSFQPLEECSDNCINNYKFKQDVKIEKHILYYKGICSNCIK